MYLPYTPILRPKQVICPFLWVIAVYGLPVCLADGSDVDRLKQLVHEAAGERTEVQTAYNDARTAAWQAGLTVGGRRAELQATKQELEAAEKHLSEKQAESPQNKEASQAAEMRLAAAQQKSEVVIAQLAEAEQSWAAGKQKLVEAERELASRSAVHTERMQSWQQALRDVDQFVSFADQIAPIFARRCIACHNARIAKGGLDMSSYTALMRGGENGQIIELGNADRSLLNVLVEASEMPQESDPLSPQQMEVIRKWIEVGAPLDAGVDPEQSLFSLLPTATHPDAPLAYAHPLAVTALAWHPSSDLLAVSGYNEVLLYRATDGHLVSRIGNVAERTYSLDFSPDGSMLAVASGIPSDLGEVKLFRIEDGMLLSHLVTSRGVVYTARFNHDGSLLAAAGEDCVIRVIQLHDGMIRFRMTDHFATVLDVAWSPDGNQLASASIDQNAKVFDMHTGLQVANFQKSLESNWGGRHFSTAFSPDGKQVLSAGNDKLVRVWNVHDAKLARDVKGFEGDVLRILVTSDGTIYSTSADKSVRVHSLSDGKLQKTLSGHRDWVHSLALHPNGTILASGDHAGRVRLWNIEEGQEILSFVAAPGFTEPES